MLSELPTELLFWICRYLQTNHILNLCLICRRTSLIFTEALFHSLLVDKVSPLFGAVTAQRLDIAARFIKEYHVNIDFEYAGKNMLLLLLAIDLQYPEAVGLILKYQPNLRSSCDLGGRGPLSLAVVGGDAPIVERFFNVKRLMSRIISAGRRLQHANPERHHIAVEMLVTHTGIDVNCQSSQHDPHLALAVKKLQGQQSVRMVESLLLHHEIYVNLSDCRGRTALWHAVNRGHYDLVKLVLRLSRLKLTEPDRYGVTPYNFDETGFAMGLTATAKVITRTEYYGKLALLQPGNREWVTVIECISAAGYVLSPYIIFKHKSLNLAWAEGLLQDWILDNSPNGWTSDEISLCWLQKALISDISHSQGGYQFLVLDGHSSHLTPKFDEICAANNIIPIYMPPHSSHLLQPLDVGCFAVLKRAYGRLVESKTRLGFNYIDKFGFLMAYLSVGVDIFKLNTI
ncbi:hypothetical protein N7478_010745 [Penicillium angulare]|uniref:uncharacterized protein n=1 Tax=Penicillium angulare TaxID=116970 RepID=UPI002541F39A|nr:uncharacterized protein N7478_010745 [Penicillium angulare]KAJ5267937.1 hypothetical protein N7478_010745 [Penicillium angulare]